MPHAEFCGKGVRPFSAAALTAAAAVAGGDSLHVIFVGRPLLIEIYQNKGHLPAQGTTLEKNWKILRIETARTIPA